MKGKERVIIENVSPQIDCGQYPAKRIEGDIMHVEADIISDGHEVVNAELLFRRPAESNFEQAKMSLIVNDRWEGEFPLPDKGEYLYTVQAWVDHFQTWHRDILKRIEANTDYSVDLLIGANLIGDVLKSEGRLSADDRTFLEMEHKRLSNATVKNEDKIESILNGGLLSVMIHYPHRSSYSRYPRELKVVAERVKAGFSSWYEFFPRSFGKEGNAHGSFRDASDFLPYISEMGFDILYLPPIHPIGKTKRKGPDNSVTAGENDPGSPWAIGGKEGGHKSIHPELGTFEDFHNFKKKAEELGLDIALDIAFQCSPDHPYVKDHPEWFRKRPDGSIQFAENPPKKYEDIYPFDFESDDWEKMWHELKSIFLFWIEKGISIFRVDNPHTKSIPFWGWVISEIRKDYPDTIFLAEAFTRPKLMYQLAKQGFTQSYTYFTWRNTKYEITEYMKKLVNTEIIDFFRPNLWPNTPDILPEFLQVNGKPGFILRFCLAATLSSNYGIYGPAFELLENEPREPGSEEYKNSEKYDIRNWDTEDHRSMRKVIQKVNIIRKENPALHNNHSLRFHDVSNDQLICYSKHTYDLSNIIVVVVNLDPHYRHSGMVQLSPQMFDIEDQSSYQVQDMLGGSFFLWHGSENYVELDPGIMPVHIFKLRRKTRTERDFDYFM